MSAIEELERGRQAAEVLENPVFTESFDQIREEVINQWQAEKSEAQRLHLWQMIQVANRLESVLRNTMATGQLVAEAIRRKQSALERGKEFLRR